jgi:hypothetical protein
VRSSVPGTPEAQEAVLLAQIPQKATVKRDSAKPEVTYAGDPEFEPIEGTSMYYAANTPNDVIRVGDIYYLCFPTPIRAPPWRESKRPVAAPPSASRASRGEASSEKTRTTTSTPAKTVTCTGTTRGAGHATRTVDGTRANSRRETQGDGPRDPHVANGRRTRGRDRTGHDPIVPTTSWNVIGKRVTAGQPAPAIPAHGGAVRGPGRVAEATAVGEGDGPEAAVAAREESSKGR